MTSAEIFSHAALVVFQHLGVPVTYTPVAGTPLTIQALISSTFQNQPSSMGSETWAQHITVEFMLSDLPGEPAPGDTVRDGTSTYTLAAPMENNGLISKWMVT
jgi:hypothetical protein